MMADKPAMNQEEVPRSEMFSRITVALDFARSAAIERGNAAYARVVDEQLSPFIEKEKFNAEVHEAAREELADALGVRQIAELSAEEHAAAWRLIRRSDAFGLMRLALQGNTIINDDDRENALSELRTLDEDATNKLRDWERAHGITK